jgi:hypothetical protein
MDMDMILFSLGYRVWVWIRKKIVNLSGMNMGKGFSLPVIYWVNYINIYIVKYIYKYNYFIFLIKIYS